MSLPTTTIKNDEAGTREWLGLAALSLPTLLISIDTSVLYLALPHLSADLHANSSQQLWVMDIYSFMIAAFLITMGNLGDKIGYRKLLIMGSAAFGLASIVAAFSPNVNILIVARGLMGVAGATIMPSTLALIRNMFVNSKQRNTAISVWMSCFMAGMIIGPLVGGTVLEHFWWGAVFLLGVPVMVIIVFAGRIILPEFDHGNARQSDIAGVIYSLSAILPFIYGLTELSRNNLHLYPIIAIIIGFIFGIKFLRHERKTPDPLIDFGLFKSKIFSLTLTAMLLTAVVMGGIALFIAQYLQIVLGLSPLHAGLWMIPQAIGMIGGSMIVPAIATKIGSGVTITIGLFITTIGMLLIANTPAANGLFLLETGFITAVIGVSPLLVLGTGIVLGSAPAEKAGAAASISETSNQLGIALGVAFLGSIGTVAYRKTIIKHLPPGLSTELSKRVSESIVGASSVANERGGQHRISLMMSAKQAFITGLHTTAATGAVIFVLLMLITAFGLSKLIQQ